jgi:hypothetical protein
VSHLTGKRRIISFVNSVKYFGAMFDRSTGRIYIPAEFFKTSVGAYFLFES